MIGIEFNDKIVVVTGAGSGIGRETARMFAKAGAVIAAIDINSAPISSLVAEIAAEGGKAAAFQLDISKEADVAKTFKAIHEHFGRIDVLVNSAGVITFDKFDVLDTQTWDYVMNINLRGTFFCSREAAAVMKAQRSGAIVNISAGAAKTGGMNPSPSYVASKGGMNSLTLHFAVKLASYGVRVNAICPGPIDTPMMDAQANLEGTRGNGKESIIASVPLGLGTPEDIAYGAMFLASDKWARYITGEILNINGGLIMD